MPRAYNLKGVPVKVLFAPDHTPELEIMKQMLKSTERVDFAIFTFAGSSGIDDAMITLARRRARVRGVARPRPGRARTWAPRHDLHARRIELSCRNRGGAFRKLHHKLMVIDERDRGRRHFNYTAPANEFNDENIFVLGSPYPDLPARRAARSTRLPAPRSPLLPHRDRAHHRPLRPLHAVSALVFRERPSAGEPAGLLVLHHGRGADEQDLLGLADVLDPERRLHVVTPRGPLTLPGWPGYHWYVVPRVGYPDPETFRMAFAALAEFHDELWERTGLGPERTVLGGFSMGAVMSHSLALPAERPAPAGILAFSGFVPVVEGWAPDLAGRSGLRAFVAHGRADPIIAVDFGRRARELLEGGGLEVEYHESDVAHQIDPANMPAARDWLSGTIAS